jgi:hypothetical protein
MGAVRKKPAGKSSRQPASWSIVPKVDRFRQENLLGALA